MFGSLNDILEVFLMSWQPSWCIRRFLYVLGTLSMFWQSSWCCGSFLDVLVTFLMSCHLCWCIDSLLGLLCSILDVIGHLLDIMPPLLMCWQPSWCAWKPWQTCVLDFQCLLLLDVMFLSWCYYYLHCLSLVQSTCMWIIVWNLIVRNKTLLTKCGYCFEIVSDQNKIWCNFDFARILQTFMLIAGTGDILWVVWLLL